MKISKIYWIGVAFVAAGLVTKPPAIWLDYPLIFDIGFGFSGLGVSILIILLIKARKSSRDV